MRTLVFVRLDITLDITRSNFTLWCRLGGSHCEHLVSPLLHNSRSELCRPLGASVWFAIRIHLEDPLILFKVFIFYFLICYITIHTCMWKSPAFIQHTYSSVPLLRKRVLYLAKHVENSSTDYPC